MILLLSVEPGFEGQTFNDSILDKVNQFKQYAVDHQLNYHIEIDGGINDVTGDKAVKAGCDVLVAGSYVFKNNISESVNLLRSLER